MECNEARPLIPSYLDGELSEAQARPLRKHLLDCSTCRVGVQGEKNLKRWFVHEGEVAIPKGFAARVARRAFAGDRGVADHADRYVSVPPGTAFERGDASTLKFILQVTSIAAVVLIFLSIAIRNMSLPSGGKLMAEDTPEVTLDQAITELERLERTDVGARSPEQRSGERRGGGKEASAERQDASTGNGGEGERR